MSNSMPSSPRSGPSRTIHDAAPVRIAWTPSRLLLGALAGLTVAACVSILLSEAPLPAAAVGVLAVLAWSTRLLFTERRRKACDVVVDGQGRVFVDEERVDDPRLHWRGPLVRLDCRQGGRACMLMWWPDTLPAARRRELRLASAALVTPRTRDSMAP